MGVALQAHALLLEVVTDILGALSGHADPGLAEECAD